MKKFLLPISLLVILLYSLSNWLGFIKEQTLTYNLLVLANISCLLCLIIASFYGVLVQANGVKKMSDEEEDARLLLIERQSYSTVIWVQVAFSISFVSFISGFMLVRNNYPKIVLYSICLFIASFLGLMVVSYLTRYTNPKFELPDPHSPTYHKELFDSFDDGEKYLMLKGLYKLYYWLILLLILLAFGLMFYSIFTEQSQLISIVGIGCILLFIQTYFALSLKPKR